MENLTHTDSTPKEKITQAPNRQETNDHRLILDESNAQTEAFTFLAFGDSGSGNDEERPQVWVARQLEKEIEGGDIQFILHLGDVIYIRGAAERYPKRFIEPYEFLLKDGRDSQYDAMKFKIPFLPVYGNHDYYNRGFWGDQGSDNGRVFNEAFIEQDPEKRKRGLRYVTPDQTRVPHRYYWFTYGQCAFIALDSNTLNVSHPPEDEKEKREWEFRKKLAKKKRSYLRDVLEEYEDEAPNDPELLEIKDELFEVEKHYDMLEHALKAEPEDHDEEQIAWLKGVLGREEVQSKKFKIVYLHHPTYTSEAGHTGEDKIRGLRANLAQHGDILKDHGVHLVLSGHAHCFEWVSAHHANDICYLVSGGGGRGLRSSALKSRPLEEFLEVAESRAFSKAHHYLRIEVEADSISIYPWWVPEPGDRKETLETRRPDQRGVLNRRKDLVGIRVSRSGPPTEIESRGPQTSQ